MHGGRIEVHVQYILRGDETEILVGGDLCDEGFEEFKDTTNDTVNKFLIELRIRHYPFNTNFMLIK